MVVVDKAAAGSLGATAVDRGAVLAARRKGLTSSCDRSGLWDGRRVMVRNFRSWEPSLAILSCFQCCCSTIARSSSSVGVQVESGGTMGVI